MTTQRSKFKVFASHSFYCGHYHTLKMALICFLLLYFQNRLTSPHSSTEELKLEKMICSSLQSIPQAASEKPRKTILLCFKSEMESLSHWHASLLSSHFCAGVPKLRAVASWGTMENIQRGQAFLVKDCSPNGRPWPISQGSHQSKSLGTLL